MKKFLKNNWEYVLIGIVGIFIVGAFFFGVNTGNLRADSGWDSDYDSGGGDWSSSSGGWDSSDSWSSSDSWGSNSYSSSGDAGSAIATLIVFLVIIVILVAIANADNKGTSANNNIHDSKTKFLTQKQDVSNEKIKKYLPDENLGSLKHMAFNKFVAIQNAWMDFDYKMLRVLCTDELYNSYISQLDTLKIKNGKNIMNAFDQEEIRITDVFEEDGLVTVVVYLRVTFYDYVINSKTKEVTRGTKDHPLTNNYMMEFVRKNNTEGREIKCPNCGNKIIVVTSKKCEYCNTTVVAPASEFVLSKKTNTNK